MAAALTAAGPGSCFALPEDLGSAEGCDRAAAKLAELEPKLHGAKAPQGLFTPHADALVAHFPFLRTALVFQIVLFTLLRDAVVPLALQSSSITAGRAGGSHSKPTRQRAGTRHVHLRWLLVSHAAVTAAAAEASNFLDPLTTFLCIPPLSFLLCPPCPSNR